MTRAWEGYDLREFERIVSRFLLCAFGSRPVCLVEVGDEDKYHAVLREKFISVSVMKLTFDYPSRLLRLVPLVRHRHYLLDFISSCPVELTQDIAGYWSFQVGGLWLTSLTPDRQDAATGLIEAVAQSNRFMTNPDTREELLAATGDGTFVLWLNPPFALEAIVSELRRIVDSFDWSFESLLGAE